MARKTVRTIPFKRKMKGKTNYKLRLKLIKSGKPRLVIRRYGNTIIAQVIEYKPEGDIVLISVQSKDLTKKGWKLKKNNIPASYMLGYIIGKKILQKQIKEVIADLGSYISTKGSKLYAIIKGVIDAGAKINCQADMLPTDDMVNGSRISNYMLTLKKDNETLYNSRFSEYIKKGVDPSKITNEIEQIKQKIDAELK